jgi:hypothetical protein
MPRPSRPLPSGECRAKSASGDLKSPSSRAGTARRPFPRGLDISFPGHYYMHIAAGLSRGPDRGAMPPRPGSRTSTDRRAPPSPKASSPRHGIPDRRRPFFDRRCTRGNGTEPFPLALLYSGGRRCGSTPGGRGAEDRGVGGPRLC